MPNEKAASSCILSRTAAAAQGVGLTRLQSRINAEQKVKMGISSIGKKTMRGVQCKDSKTAD